MDSEIIIAEKMLERGCTHVILFPSNSDLLPLYVRSGEMAIRIIREEFHHEHFEILLTSEYLKNIKLVKAIDTPN